MVKTPRGFGMAKMPEGLSRALTTGYTDHDHQWLLSLCSQLITLAEYRRLYKRRRYFKDYPALLQASVVYFGPTLLGWPYVAVEKPLNMNRTTAAKLAAKIEDLRRDGDVFERIERRIEVYRGGLL